MRIYYRREVPDLNSDKIDPNSKIIEYKIGNKDDLLNYITQHFNVDKKILNFEFQNKKTFEEIDKQYNLINNIKNKNTNCFLDLDDIFNEVIDIKIDEKTKLHIYRHILTNIFKIQKLPLQNDKNNDLLFFWSEE